MSTTRTVTEILNEPLARGKLPERLAELHQTLQIAEQITGFSVYVWNGRDTFEKVYSSGTEAGTTSEFARMAGDSIPSLTGHAGPKFPVGHRNVYIGMDVAGERDYFLGVLAANTNGGGKVVNPPNFLFGVEQTLTEGRTRVVSYDRVPVTPQGDTTGRKGIAGSIDFVGALLPRISEPNKGMPIAVATLEALPVGSTYCNQALSAPLTRVLMMPLARMIGNYRA